jgi:uncharacterized membrane protein YedE/YeeE
METEFTPLVSLAGGLLIGLASALLMFLRGRVFGATGILAGFISPESSGDWAWRAALLAGMFTGPIAVFALTGQMPAVDVPVSNLALVIGGIIVGLGVTFGGGCTSGHGVCGIARFSPRSITATVVFMAASFVTVYIIRHVIGGL